MLTYCLDRYKTQETCNKTDHAFIPALKFVPDWFFTNRMLEKLNYIVVSNDNIVFVNEDSDSVPFFSDDMDLDIIYIDNINFDDDNFDDNDP